MDNIINQIIVLFMIMAVGFYARKKGMINSEVNRGLSSLLLNITLPFMIIASFNIEYTSDILVNGVKLLIYSIIIYLIVIPVSKLLYFRLPQNKSKVLRFITIFSNCGFMGYPVIESIYGKTGVLYTAIFNIPFNILIWILGISIFAGKMDSKTVKKILINPGIISTIIGIIIFIFEIKIPLPIYNTLSIVGSMTTPISMIVVGAMLADVKIMDVFSDASIYYGSLVRLIIIPLIILFVLKAFKVSEMFLGIPVLIMAMPGAANAAIMAEMYGGDAAYASKCIFITTMLSAITIPLIISIM